ncbi:MAG TPA: ROK family protein [Ktedonobacteraceae bacterium]|nr:ROK family protein [Ktedonobacteraceae bacterium]
MSTQHTSDMLAGTPLVPARPGTEAGTQRTTGKLLATQGYVAGIEISGSGSRQSVALADLNGKILQRVRRPLDYVPDTRTVLGLIDTMLDEVTASVRDKQTTNGGRILRVGVAVGGLVDTRSGVVQTLHHAHGWDNFPLQDYLAERLDIPCIIDNNANAAALAEAQYGAGVQAGSSPRKAERALLYIGLGRGIGGGLVLNGKIYHGASCTAGEIGHLLVEENGAKCSCGGYGHLETIASAPAIAGAMIGLSVEYPETEAAIRRVTGNRAERITAVQVFQLAAEGDAVAQRIVENVLNHLGIALANIVHFINPGIIILGGQVAQAGDLLIQPLRERIQQLCLPAASRSVQIVQGKLGSEANIVGAVTLALQDL